MRKKLETLIDKVIDEITGGMWDAKVTLEWATALHYLEAAVGNCEKTKQFDQLRETLASLPKADAPQASKLADLLAPKAKKAGAN